MSVKTGIIGATGVRPLAAMWADAVALKASLAACEIRLLKDSELVINVNTTLAELDAEQADYSGYTAGGVEVAAAGDPYLSDDGDVLVTLPSVQFHPVPGTPNVTNSVRGAYCVDSAGVLRGIMLFDEPQYMGTIYNSVVASMTFKVL